MKVHVVGGGLAGSEITYRLAKKGVHVILHEMRPKIQTPVHRTGYFAELVCSNSLKSEDITNGAGLLKAEMRSVGSLILEVAEEVRIPAGKALAVDRNEFARRITDRIKSMENVEIHVEEVKKIELGEDEIWIVATGPMTSQSLLNNLSKKIGRFLNFIDAVSPILYSDSIDLSKVFIADRYGVGKGDHLNCPLNEKEYDRLWKALIEAEVVELKEFEKHKLFERCMPIEEIARSGKDAMRYGPLRPVGIVDPRTGKEPYAVVQLRRDNLEGTLYNIVGFQTRMKWREQKRIIRLIPGLENAEIARYGVMHVNVYLDSPKVLDRFLRLKKNDRIFFAGQITGVEGYLESAASGIYVATNILRMMRGKEPVIFPEDTMIGALMKYITSSVMGELKPMYANFGLLPPPKRRIKNRMIKRKKQAERALKSLEIFKEKVPEVIL